MKLRNLAYAAMIAMAFTACSNENDPTPQPEGDGTAQLTVNIAKPVATKAVADGFVSDFAILVFDGATDAAQLERIAWKAGPANSTTTYESDCIEDLTSGAKQVLVLANTVTGTVVDGKMTNFKIGETSIVEKTTSAAGTTLGTILGLKYAPENMPSAPLEKALMLSSQVYNVSLLPNVHNLLGYKGTETPIAGTHTPTNYLNAAPDPVKLYRNVAKINLTSITFNDAKFPGASLKIIGIYALNGNKETYIASKTAWGSLESKEGGFFGLTNTDFAAWAGSKNAYIEDWKSYVGATKYVEEPSYMYFLDMERTAPKTPAAYNLEVEDGGGFSFYAFENEGTKDATPNFTLVVIKADFNYLDNGVAKTLYNQYYVIPVGSVQYAKADFSAVEGNVNFPQRYIGADAQPYTGIMRNLEYNIAVSIKGMGSSKSPDDPEDEDPETPGEEDPGTINPPSNLGALDVRMTVVEYGKVSQTPEF